MPVNSYNPGGGGNKGFLANLLGGLMGWNKATATNTVNVYGQTKQDADAGELSAVPQSAPPQGVYPDQTNAGSAIDRAIEQRQSDPDYLIHQGLSAANDPNLPLDYDTRMSIAEKLARAKVYGYGGGLSQGQGQGKINGGGESGGKAGGAIGTIVGALV